MKRSYLLNQAVLAMLIAFLFSACSKKDNPNPHTTPPKTTPVITSLSAAQGGYNTSVIITGTNFSADASNDRVFFNGKQGVVTAATATTITARVPLGAGTGYVTVSVDNSPSGNGPVFNYELSLYTIILAGDGEGAPGSTDGPGTSASFNKPNGLVLDASGNVYVADNVNNKIRKISPSGLVSTYAAASNPQGIVLDATGNVYYTDFGSGTINKITTTGNETTFVSGFNHPFGLAIDAAGNLYVADQQNNAVKKITTSGTVSTLAGNLHSPTGVAVDAAGNVYVSDTKANEIDKISPGGTVTVLAGSTTAGLNDGIGASAGFSLPAGIAVDGSGNVYVADQNNQTIRKITQAGVVTTIAGQAGIYGPPSNNLSTSVHYDYPAAVALDAAGNIYNSDAAVIYKLSLQ